MRLSIAEPPQISAAVQALGHMLAPSKGLRLMLHERLLPALLAPEMWQPASSLLAPELMRIVALMRQRAAVCTDEDRNSA